MKVANTVDLKNKTNELLRLARLAASCHSTHTSRKRGGVDDAEESGANRPLNRLARTGAARARRGRPVRRRG